MAGDKLLGTNHNMGTQNYEGQIVWGPSYWLKWLGTNGWVQIHNLGTKFYKAQNCMRDKLYEGQIPGENGWGQIAGGDGWGQIHNWGTKLYEGQIV